MDKIRWSTEVLKYLLNSQYLSSILIFKGGTSLSKVLYKNVRHDIWKLP